MGEIGHRGPSGGRLAAAGLGVLFLTLGLACCSAGGSTARRGVQVVVVEHDFGLAVSSGLVRAGAVTLHIENRGPSTHELNVDRTAVGAAVLPLRANSLQVNEDSARLVSVGSVADIRVGTATDLTLNLLPGRYVLFCNLEGHYLGGMHVALEVSA